VLNFKQLPYFVVKVILQLAESGSFFGQVDLFKVRGKFALSDAYEDHFMLRKGKILMVTHRRVILLQVCIHDFEQ
jgi:vacuolar protein sorting-associated protein 13A/C